MLSYLYHNNEKYSYRLVKEEDVVEMARYDPFALDYLMKKYNNFIKFKVKGYYIRGAEREDLVQEGMIGLYKAIMAYDTGRTISFRNFAYLCITRQIITAIKTATRQKHVPLNSYISLNKPINEEENERTLQELIGSDENLDPMYIYISSEELREIGNRISKRLSELELMILMPYVDGKTYREIANETKKSEKCIDNALQRIRRKLEDFFFIEDNC